MNTEVLLDPAKEKFDLPKGSVKLGDNLCVKSKVVGNENQRSILFHVDQLHTTWRERIILSRVGSSQPGCLIASQAGLSIYWITFQNEKPKIVFGQMTKNAPSKVNQYKGPKPGTHGPFYKWMHAL
jgi:hypothetical protein